MALNDESGDWLDATTDWGNRNPRDTWNREVQDLQPWVIANLPVLGDELGLTGLTYVGNEAGVGDFRVDVDAHDTAGRRVLIECQFGPSDHRHFGQVVLYACEARADVIIWLVTGDSRRYADGGPMRKEHRSALAILNERLSGDTAFFGVELPSWASMTPFSDPIQEPQWKPWAFHQWYDRRPRSVIDRLL